MLVTHESELKSGFRRASSFRSWQRTTMTTGLLPVIAVAGTRGKSTVVRVLDAIFRQAHLRTATWTNLGVEIRGRRQRGELSGWSLALSRLAEGTVDVAIQELHWATINAVGLPRESYPVAAINTLGASRDPADSMDDVTTSLRAVSRLGESAHRTGFIVAPADDHLLLEALSVSDASGILVAKSKETPAIRRHAADGGASAWLEDGEICLGDDDVVQVVCTETDVPITMHGAASFQLLNVMTAAATAHAMGIDLPTIRAALKDFRTAVDILPGSFNVYDASEFSAVVDRLVPSWQVRPILRAANPGGRRRQISVVGSFDGLPPADIRELGRLLGRYHGAIVLHSNECEAHLRAFRSGLAANEFPPLLITLPTERRALNRALKTAHSNDVLLVLYSGDPAPSLRALTRQVRSI